jgi:hypothetical protein
MGAWGDANLKKCCMALHLLHWGMEAGRQGGTQRGEVNSGERVGRGVNLKKCSTGFHLFHRLCKCVDGWWNWGGGIGARRGRGGLAVGSETAFGPPFCVEQY